MLLLSFVLVKLVQAEEVLKVMVHMSLGTNSHIKPLLEIGAVLRERNHSVFYSSFETNKKYNKPYKFPFISLGNDADAEWDPRAMKAQYATRNHEDPIKEIAKTFGVVAPGVYDKTYPIIVQVMKEEKPDVVMCDFIATACREAAQMLGIPFITGFQPTDMYGITEASFLTTEMVYGSITTESLTFFQRLQSKVIQPLLEYYYYRSMVNGLNVIRAKYGVPPSSTPYGDFSTSLGLASSFFGFEASFPYPPYIKMIGPIKSISYPPLTPELTKFLEAHPKTVYIALGSIVIMTDFDIENLAFGCLQALSEGSIDGVIWGLGNTIREDFPEVIEFNATKLTRDQLLNNKLPHIKLLPWAPQKAILEHKNTKLFISHGGLESSFEAIFSATPVLCMPYLGDQPRNARKLEDAGIGKYINRATATPTTVSDDIKYIMQDSTGSFLSNTQRMRTIAEHGSRRKSIGADAVEEYIEIARACRPLQTYRYGEIPCELKHLAMASRNMPYITANLIDVYIFVALTLLAFLVALVYMLAALMSYILPPTSIDQQKKNQ
ncbi:hypothetical protein DSO57_1038077 [Entomophthora muscae]|uniref:Uncharacterized protein n=1 Tax=Entomophthora muscae TaxID=34485 RepID=A0ACC2SNE7_9FUNG|nr:hypothetical protein DSO57_1038077 [Entomophthora muscae]